MNNQSVSTGCTPAAPLRELGSAGIFLLTALSRMRDPAADWAKPCARSILPAYVRW
jgi:hypothetical protein